MLIQPTRDPYDLVVNRKGEGRSGIGVPGLIAYYAKVYIRPAEDRLHKCIYRRNSAPIADFL